MSTADDPLIARIRQLNLPEHFGIVLHLGATVENLALHQKLPASLRILVQGDTEAHRGFSDMLPQWERQTEGRMQLWPDVVAAEVGTVNWRRYNVRGLSGPLDLDRLTFVYPRLTSLSVTERQAVGIGDLVRRALSAQQPGEEDLPRLLILDLPGQETSLLDALGAAGLEPFDWIMFRGFREPIGDDVPGVDLARARLEAEHRVRVWSSSGDSSGLLVTELHRFDRVEKALTLWRARAERAESDLALLRQDRANQLKRSQDLIYELDQLRQELAERSAEVTQLEAAERRAVAELVQAQAEAEAARKALTEEHVRVHQQSQRADRHARSAEALASEVQQLKSMLAESKAEQGVLQAELGRANQQLQELRSAVEQAEHSRAAEALRASAAEDRAILAIQRAEDAEGAAAREAARVQEQSQRADRHARDSAARQAALEELSGKLEQAMRSLEQEQGRALEVDKQLDATREKVLSLQKQQQQSEALAAGLRAELQSEVARLAALKEELTRADSQLDLIKDLLLHPSLP